MSDKKNRVRSVVVGNSFANKDDVFRSVELPGGEDLIVMNELVFNVAVAAGNKKLRELQRERKAKVPAVHDG